MKAGTAGSASPSAAGACWPTPQQELLLRAALLRTPQAIEAWAEWKRSQDLDGLDPGSHRLLPQLYHNLGALGVQDPEMERLKGVYRHSWSKNQMLLQAITSVLRGLHERGIRTLLLKGIPLALQTYPNLGLRPMEDADVLVPRAQAPEAIRELLRQGWTVQRGLPEAIHPRGGVLDAERLLAEPLAHAWSFQDGARRQLDLHWYVLRGACAGDPDTRFWDGAVPLALQGLSTESLNRTDQLLHVCVHGLRLNFVPPLRWVADAALLLERGAQPLNWQRLERHARDRRIGLQLHAALEYLRRTLEAPVPPEVLQSLAALPSSRLERLEYRIATLPLGERGLLANCLEPWLDYRRFRVPASRPSPGRFLRYLRYRWRLRSLWQLPAQAMFRALRKAGLSFH